MMAIKSAPQSASLADTPCSADQSGIMRRFPILAIAGFSASGAKASSDISAAASEGFIDSKHCSRGPV
jgi:hypothetical protein